MGSVVIILLVFRLGIVLGLKKADTRYQWGENYGRVFGTPQAGFFRDFSGDGSFNPYGNGGKVLEVSNGAIVIEGSDSNEKAVNVGKDTVIRSVSGNVTLDSIKPGDSLVIIGGPDGSGGIDARFIRVLDQK